MTPENDSILLIYPVDQEALPVDRLGGKYHGAIAKEDKFGIKKIDIAQVSSSLSRQTKKLSEALAKCQSDDLAEFSLDEISLSFAMTTSGSIGFATTGVQASITVVLKREAK